MTTVHNQIHATLKAVNDHKSELFERLDGKEARKYSVSDTILVDRRNLKIPDGGKRVLSDRWIGPFKVIMDKWDSNAYKVDILARTRIHGVINFSLLKPYNNARSAAPSVP